MVTNCLDFLPEFTPDLVAAVTSCLHNDEGQGGQSSISYDFCFI